MFKAKTAEDFLGNLKLLAKTTDRMEGAKVALSSVLRGVNKTLEAVGVRRNGNVDEVPIIAPTDDHRRRTCTRMVTMV